MNPMVVLLFRQIKCSSSAYEVYSEVIYFFRTQSMYYGVFAFFVLFFVLFSNNDDYLSAILFGIIGL